jgi:hypothetical protein
MNKIPKTEKQLLKIKEQYIKRIIKAKTSEQRFRLVEDYSKLKDQYEIRQKLKMRRVA